MEQCFAQQRLCMRTTAAKGRVLPLPLPSRAASSIKTSPVRRRHHSATAHSRFFNIQIQASWGNGQSSSSSSSGGEAYIDSQPRWGGFLNSSSSSSGSSGGNAGGSSSSSGGSSSGSTDSPITRLLSAAVAHVRAAPLPGAAPPWLVLPLLPVVLWCVGWVSTTGMFTLAQCAMSGMCSVAALLYPSIPLKGASYEDIAVSLVKALQTGTDTPSTWTRPGLLAPAWLLRWLMSSMYGLATAGTGLAATLMHSGHLLALTGISKGLLYVSCLLFMLPLGSGLNNLAAGFMAQFQQFKASKTQQSESSSGSSGYGLSALGSGSSSSGFGAAAAAAAGAADSSSSKKTGWSLPQLSDTAALTLKLAGVLAWPCISAAAVLQPALLLQANSATSHLSIAAPQVLLCCCLLALLLTVAATAAMFGWEIVRRQADEDTVVDFGLQLGVLCGLQAVLNVVQLGLSIAGRQVELSQLGMPVLSTLILCRVVWTTWRLWRIGAYASSVWLQVLTLTPNIPSSSSSAGGSGSGGGFVGSSGGFGSSGGGSSGGSNKGVGGGSSGSGGSGGYSR